MPDKFAAVWVSHSSLSDFDRCPRAYFLKNVYKDPTTRHKIQIMAPALALGQAVHEVLEALSVQRVADRFNPPLVQVYERVWSKFAGQQGGFNSPSQEQQYKERGVAMLTRVTDHPGPLSNLSIKVKEELPYIWLSEEQNVILCGKIDWLEYVPDGDGVNILDFKTGKHQERADSLQLPIYLLLVSKVQGRPVMGASYWYLETDDEPTEMSLPTIEQAQEQITTKAMKVNTARKLGVFNCPQGDKGCSYCQPFEAILRGEATLVGEHQRKDIYSLPDRSQDALFETEVL